MRGQPQIVRELIDKSKDSALLAVEVYNKPSITFRSGAFIVLMIIAWGALLQAILYKKHISYYERRGKRFVYINNEKKVWPISKFISAYFTDVNNPVRKNLEFFISLRDKLEHRNYPELDQEIYGECQALLMNFEEVLTNEFAKENPLEQNLVFALQFSKMTTPQQQKAIRKKLGNSAYQLLDFVKRYRAEISDDVRFDPKFSFKVFVIPKIGNNKNNDDVAIEFIKYDAAKPEEIERLQKLGVLIKEKMVEVPSQKFYRLKPGDVAIQVANKIGKPFSITMHVKAWRYYKIRPRLKSGKDCNLEYCLFDEPHKDYVYSDKWVEFLTLKLNDQSEYERVRAVKL